MYTEDDIENARVESQESFNQVMFHIRDAVNRMKWGNFAVSEDRETLEYYTELLNTYSKYEAEN